MKRAIMIAAALFALAACDDKKTDTKPEDPSVKNATTTTTASVAATTTAATPTPAAVSINDGDLSTPADFEESAEKSITKTTYKTELSTLESDIAKD
jgi:hypothetical protein